MPITLVKCNFFFLNRFKLFKTAFLTIAEQQIGSFMEFEQLFSGYIKENNSLLETIAQNNAM